MKKGDKLVCIKDLIRNQPLPEFEKEINDIDKICVDKMLKITKKYPQPRTPEQKVEINLVFAECENMCNIKTEDKYHDVIYFKKGKIYDIKKILDNELMLISDQKTKEYFILDKESDSLYNFYDHFITIVEARKNKLDDLQDQNFSTFLKNLFF